MTRLRSFLVSVVALALLLAGCAETRAWAAIVDDTEIARSELTDQLEAIRADEDLTAAFAGAGFEVGGDGDSADARFAAVWLTQIIQSEVLRQAAEKEGVEVTEAIEEVARQLAAQQYVTPEADDALLPPEEQAAALAARLDELPSAFRDVAVDQLVGLVAYVVPEEDVELACTRHILVSAQPDPTTGQAADPEVARAEAEALRVRIVEGEDFAAVAAAESDDPGSAQAGGDLGCLAAGATVPEFDAAVAELEPGELSEVVATQLGFHIIEVTSSVVEPFDELELQDRIIYVTTALQTLDPAEVNSVLEDADVEVDPSFGEWVVDESGARVEPPEVTEVQQRPAPPTTEQLPTGTDPFGSAPPGSDPSGAGPAETPPPTG